MKTTDIKKLLVIFLTVFVLMKINISAQVVYVNINDPVYTYLDRLNIKGIISIDSEVKPFTRAYIGSKLLELRNKLSRLSSTEKEELTWHLREYKEELNLADVEKRIVLFRYSDSLFNFSLSPIAGYGLTNNYAKSGHSRNIGFKTSISYSDWFGGQLNMSDNGQFGDNIDKIKQLSPERGRDPISVSNGIEFSDVRTQINLSQGWVSLSFNKDYQEWGNAYFGNLILSDKAPSYPNFRIELKPVKWLRFYYTFGWVHSGIIDSSSIITFSTTADNLGTFEQFINKYHVANMLTVSPWDFVDISFGNSIIFAGNFRPEMMLPFNFFKYMDRDVGKKSQQDGNGQLFFDVAVRYPQKYKFYTTFFLDVTEIRNILEGDFWNTWFGFTVGGKRVGLLLDDLDLTLEYTRVNPWVYEHKLELTNYKHLNYSLGHWIGQNADQFRIQLNYQFIRRLRTELYFESFRKGTLGDVLSEAYRDKEVEPFLYGEIRKETKVGLNVSYEPIHELFLRLNYRYSNISDEMEFRTPEFMLGSNHSFGISVIYGMP